ncbi:hypothetical protein HK099_005047 [Clydaea vesicula]|uniref:Restriction endonuclease type IV Mrr domain-containing protein n=1 Tax=Clydaea vesicula TaxID=447962 RepID=A0AAD5U6I5_9FUNG|nr:hypothetical protein HK099_005047 [Clydaea vesicula]
MLKKLSTVEVGTKFELATMSTLKKLNFDLRRIGGAGDNGVDLTGFWNLKKKLNFPVVVQCKREKKKIGTNYLRELEGVLSRRERKGSLGFLVSSEGFTSKSVTHFNSSILPLFLVHLKELQLKTSSQTKKDDFFENNETSYYISDFKMNKVAEDLIKDLKLNRGRRNKKAVLENQSKDICFDIFEDENFFEVVYNNKTIFVSNNIYKLDNETLKISTTNSVNSENEQFS